jgi:hypothetical protein
MIRRCAARRLVTRRTIDCPSGSLGVDPERSLKRDPAAPDRHTVDPAALGIAECGRAREDERDFSRCDDVAEDRRPRHCHRDPARGDSHLERSVSVDGHSRRSDRRRCLLARREGGSRRTGSPFRSDGSLPPSCHGQPARGRTLPAERCCQPGLSTRCGDCRDRVNHGVNADAAPSSRRSMLRRTRPRQ